MRYSHVDLNTNKTIDIDIQSKLVTKKLIYAAFDKCLSTCEVIFIESPTHTREGLGTCNFLTIIVICVH